MRAYRHVGGGWHATLVLLLAMLPAACTHVQQQPPAPGVVAQLSLERFMRAVNQRDLVTMGETFGTAEGPLNDTGSTFGCFFKKIGSWFGGTACRTKSEVQIRMAAIADILKHEDYKVVDQEPVAGELTEARRLFVDMTVGDRHVQRVPFVMVRSKKGQWLVQKIDLQKVMGGG